MWLTLDLLVSVGCQGHRDVSKGFGQLHNEAYLTTDVLVSMGILSSIERACSVYCEVVCVCLIISG